MSHVTITGTVHLVMDLQTFKNDFTKQTLVINEPSGRDGKYTQLIPVDFIKERTALLDDLTVGQAVTVEADLGGREYNGRYFVDLKGWKVDAGAAPADDGTGDGPPDDDNLDYGAAGAPF